MNHHNQKQSEILQRVPGDRGISCRPIWISKAATRNHDQCRNRSIPAKRKRRIDPWRMFILRSIPFRLISYRTWVEGLRGPVQSFRQFYTTSRSCTALAKRGSPGRNRSEAPTSIRVRMARQPGSKPCGGPKVTLSAADTVRADTEKIAKRTRRNCAGCCDRARSRLCIAIWTANPFVDRVPPMGRCKSEPL